MLRDATAEAHHALDTTVGSFDSPDRYAAYLRANFAFRAAVEHGLSGLKIDGWEPRTLTDTLRHDLSAMGIAPADVTPAPPLSGSALLGRLYVLEGAALGGQILHRRALSRNLPARHLEGDVQNWRAFLDRLERAPDYDPADAARGANDTFARACAAFFAERAA